MPVAKKKVGYEELILGLPRGVLEKELESATTEEPSHWGRHISAEGKYIGHCLRLCNFSTSTVLLTSLMF